MNRHKYIKDEIYDCKLLTFLCTPLCTTVVHNTSQITESSYNYLHSQPSGKGLEEATHTVTGDTDRNARWHPDFQLEDLLKQSESMHALNNGNNHTGMETFIIRSFVT